MRIEAWTAGSVLAGLLLGGAWLAATRLDESSRVGEAAAPAIADRVNLPRDLEPGGATAATPDYPDRAPTLPELARADDQELREESAALLDAMTAEAADGE